MIVNHHDIKFLNLKPFCI